MDPAKTTGRTTKVVVSVVALVVLGAALAIPFGLSLVALFPVLILLIVIGSIYMGWHQHQVSAGHEAIRGRIQPVGGSESARAEAARRAPPR